MKVYRVEHKDHGSGPFACSEEPYHESWGRERYGAMESPDGCHAPNQDFGDNAAIIATFGMGYRCKPIFYGCDSLEGLKVWFNEIEWERLQAEGFRVVSYDVAGPVACMSTQCAWLLDGHRRTVVEGFHAA